MDFKNYCSTFARSTQPQEAAQTKFIQPSKISASLNEMNNSQKLTKINNYTSINTCNTTNTRTFGREISNTDADRSALSVPQGFIAPQKNNNILSKRPFREIQQGGMPSSADENFNKTRQMSVELPLQQQQFENQHSFLSRPSIRTQHQAYQPDNNGKRLSKQADRHQFLGGKSSYDKENVYCYANKGNMEEEEEEQTVSLGQINYQSQKRRTMQPQSAECYFLKDKLEQNPVFQHAREIFDYLHNTENDFRARGTMQHVQNNSITERMRAILVDWLVDVHLKFKLVPETLFLAVNLIDRFIERKVIAKEHLQLLGSTAMFVACKYEEIYPPELADFVFICDNLYSKQEILATEGELITIIDFTLSFSSPLRFLHRFAFLSGSSELHFFCAQYLLELSLGEYSMTNFTSSLLGASALYLVNKIFEVSTPWCEELRIQSGYTFSDLKECSKELWQLLKKANELQLRCQRQIFNIEQQEQEETAQLLDWYNESKTILSSRAFDQDSAEQLENEYATKKKLLETKIKELKSGVLSGTKNLVAVLRKFSLPKFQETAQLLLKMCTQQ